MSVHRIPFLEHPDSVELFQTLAPFPFKTDFLQYYYWKMPLIFKVNYLFRILTPHSPSFLPLSCSFVFCFVNRHVLLPMALPPTLLYEKHTTYMHSQIKHIYEYIYISSPIYKRAHAHTRTYSSIYTYILPSVPMSCKFPAKLLNRVYIFINLPVLSCYIIAC
jgi:hypothetical protein